MRRLLTIGATTLLALALTAPAALAFDGGEGLYGETDDKITTTAGFMVMAGFILVISLFSALQWRLEKRKEAHKAAVKARSGRTQWRGGW